MYKDFQKLLSYLRNVKNCQNSELSLKKKSLRWTGSYISGHVCFSNTYLLGLNIRTRFYNNWGWAAGKISENNVVIWK